MTKAQFKEFLLLCEEKGQACGHGHDVERWTDFARHLEPVPSRRALAEFALHRMRKLGIDTAALETLLALMREPDPVDIGLGMLAFARTRADEQLADHIQAAQPTRRHTK